MSSTISFESIINGPAVRTPRVGYDNLFSRGTVTVSSEDADHPKELAYDGFTYDGWRTLPGSPNGDAEWIAVQPSGSPSAEAADYMAVGAHTLSGCTLTPQYLSSGSPTWENLVAPFVAQSNRPIVWEFSLASRLGYRLLIEDSAGAVQIGAIHCGQMFTLPRGFKPGWKPPSMNEDITYSNAISNGGQILGRQVQRRGSMVDAQVNDILFTVARGDWQAFLDAAETKAFFFWRVIEGYAEIVYGGLTKRAGTLSQRGLLSTVSFSMEGISR